MKKQAIISVLGKRGDVDVYVKGWHVLSHTKEVYWSRKREEASRFNSKSEARRMGFQLLTTPFVVEIVTD